MPRMSNTPKQPLTFDLERRKSYSFQVNLVNGDGSKVDLTSCTLRFVVKEQDWDDDQFDVTNLLFNSAAFVQNPITGIAYFNFQAAELDWPAGEYSYAIVLWTPDGYSAVIVKGVFNLLANTESDSMHHNFSVGTPEAILELTLRSNDVINIAVNNLALGARGRQGERGDPGEKGEQGNPGEKGDPGDDATISIGTVTTGDAGTPVSITNVGTPNHAVFDFQIPEGIQGIKGDTGDKGDKGDRGDVGPAGLEWRGVWSAETDYVIDDAVQYSNASWVASADPPLGEVPSDASLYWQALALQGAQGDKGDKGDKGDTGDVGPAGVDGMPVGSIQLYAGASAPAGWLSCDGSTFSSATYPALAGVLGTTYGGTVSNPALPNLKGRVPVGLNTADPTFTTLGQTGGEKNHTLTVSEMPTHTHVQDAHNHAQDAHNHTQNAHNHTQDEHNHSQNSHNHPSNLSRIRAGTAYSLDVGSGSANSFETDVPTGYTTATNNPTTATNQATTATNNPTTATNQATTATNQNSGGGGSHNNLQPYIVLLYIIKAG